MRRRLVAVNSHQLQQIAQLLRFLDDRPAVLLTVKCDRQLREVRINVECFSIEKMFEMLKNDNRWELWL